MKSKILIKIIVLTLLIIFLIYLCFSPKITSKPTLDKNENAVLFIDEERFSYKPAVRFNNPVTWSLKADSVSGEHKPDITINPENGQMHWSEKQGGLWELTITASNWLGTDSQTFLVKHIIKPFFEIRLPSTIPAGSEFAGNVKITGTQPMELACDNSQIKFNFKRPNNWDAEIYWPIPKAGKYSIRFGAINQAGEYHQSWGVIVKELPVKIISKPPAEAIVGKDYVYEVQAIGSPELTWELLEHPEGMTINKNGTIILPAENVKEGEYNIKITVSNKVEGRKYTHEQQYTLICRKQETVTREIPIDDIIKIVKREEETTEEEPPDKVEETEAEMTMEEPPATEKEIKVETTEEEPPDKIEEEEAEMSTEEPPDKIEEEEVEMTMEELPDKVEETEEETTMGAPPATGEEIEEETTEEEPLDKEEESEEETSEEESTATLSVSEQEETIEEISVPEEFSDEDIEKGKEVRIRYFFSLKGWNFKEFWNLVVNHKFKVLYISEFEGVRNENYEVSGLDSKGNPVLKMKSWNDNYYSYSGAYVDGANEHLGKYDKYLYEEYDTDPSYEYKMVLFFPYNFLAYFEKAAKQYYRVHKKDPDISFEKGAGKIKFTITKDYKFKILSMGNTR